MSWSIAAAAALSTGNLFHVRGAATQLLRRRPVDGTTRLPRDEALIEMYIDLALRQPVSEGPRYTPVCVPKTTCEPASTTCTGSTRRLETSATLGEPESRGHVA